MWFLHPIFFSMFITDNHVWSLELKPGDDSCSPRNPIFVLMTEFATLIALRNHLKTWESSPDLFSQLNSRSLPSLLGKTRAKKLINSLINS